MGKVLETSELESSLETKHVACERKELQSESSEDLLDGDGVNVDVDVRGKDSRIRFKDLGGMDDVLDKLSKEIVFPLRNPHVPKELGVSPIKGILLHGPPGCGKTSLAHAIANEARVPFYKVAATELISNYTSDTSEEENIRNLFSKAYKTAPSIVFIDEIDAIASKREDDQYGWERRMVNQLMTSMSDPEKAGYVLVIGATNRPDALDPALRRPGRFDREISLDLRDENSRLKILSALTREVKHDGLIDLVKIARSTPGFVGSDLKSLVDTAGCCAWMRGIEIERSKDTEQNEDWCEKIWTPEEARSVYVRMPDYEEALKVVQPSTKREGFSSSPNVKWEDIGGFDTLRKKFEEHIVRRIKYPDEYKGEEDNYETGFLLYGPPGCGKTLIAQAVANEAGANFIHIHGPEILDKWIGESESKVRTIFSRARKCAPCILFFDEIDSLSSERTKETRVVHNGILTQLLTELDGGDQRKGVYVIGATNRPDFMDRALLRPGRLGEHMYVSLPNEDERVSILKAVSRKMRLDDDVDLNAIARSEACSYLNGTDLAKLMRIASTIAHQEKLNKIEAAAHEGTSVLLSHSCLRGKPYNVKADHIMQALEKTKPSVPKQDRQFYDRMEKRFKAS